MIIRDEKIAGKRGRAVPEGNKKAGGRGERRTS